MQKPAKPSSLHWTFHSRAKMRQYRLTEARVRRILHSPNRVEEGIAPKTAAFMQKSGSPKHPHELWVMVQDKGRLRRVISAWRYPGTTKPRSGIALEFLRLEYADYAEKESRKERLKEKVGKTKWFKWPKRTLRGPGRPASPRSIQVSE